MLTLNLEVIKATITGALNLFGRTLSQVTIYKYQFKHTNIRFTNQNHPLS